MFGYARYYIQRRIDAAPSCDPVPPGTRDFAPRVLRTDFYDTPSVESIANMVVDQYGATYAVGTFSRDYEDPSYNDTLREAVLWKINSNGDLLWEKGLKTGPPGGYNDESFTGIAVDAQSNVYVTGHSNEQTWPARLIVGKCDACGTFLWKKILKQRTNDISMSGVRCALDTTGTKLFVTGGITRFDGTYNYNNMLLICFSASTGDVLWNREIRHPNYENYYGLDIGVDNQNNVIIVSEPNDDNYIIAKFEAETGNTVWMKELTGLSVTYGASSTSLFYQPYALGGQGFVDQDGALYLIFQHSATYTFRIVKINPDGTKAWEQELTDGDTDGFSPKITGSTTGHVYIAYGKDSESTSLFYNVENAYWFIRVVCLNKNDGSLNFTRQVTLPTNEIIDALAVNSINCDETNYYITGEFQEINNNSSADPYPRGFVLRFPLDGTQTDFYYYLMYTEDSDGITVEIPASDPITIVDSLAQVLATGPSIGGGVGTSGYQDIIFDPGAGPIGGLSTELPNDASTYGVQVVIDGGSPIDVVITGTEAQTFDDLLAKLQTSLPTCSVAFEGMNAIRVTSGTAGENSSILISDYPFVGGNGYTLTSTNWGLNDTVATATFQFNGPADLTFEWKASTEATYDPFSVSVDTVQIVYATGEAAGVFNGSYGPGLHEVVFSFEKDCCYAEGQDTVRVSNLAVNDLGGLSLISSTYFDVAGGPGSVAGVRPYLALMSDGFGGTTSWNLSYYSSPAQGGVGDFQNIDSVTGLTESTFTTPHKIKRSERIPSRTDTEVWVLQSDGAFDWEESFAVDSEGNVITVETKSLVGQLVKIDPQGNTVWNRKLTLSALDFIYTHGTDFFVVYRSLGQVEKYDKDANRIWATKYTTGGLLFGAIDGAGNLACSTGANGVVKFDGATGAVLWSKLLNVTWTSTWRLAADNLGNTYVSSQGYVPGGSSDDRISITKLDTTGNLVWTRDLVPNPAVLSDLPGDFEMEEGVIRFDDATQTLIGAFTIWSHIIIMGFDADDGTTKWELCLAQLYENYPRPLGSVINSDGHFAVCIDTFRTTIFVVDPATGELVRKFFLSPETYDYAYPIGSRVGASYVEAWGISADDTGHMYQTIGYDFMIKIPNAPEYGYFRNIWIDEESLYAIDPREISFNVPGTANPTTNGTYTAAVGDANALTDGTDWHLGFWKIAAYDPVKSHYDSTGLISEMVPLNGGKAYYYIGGLAYKYGTVISVDSANLVIGEESSFAVFERRADGGWDTAMSNQYIPPSYNFDHISHINLKSDTLVIGAVSVDGVSYFKPGYVSVFKKQPSGLWKTNQLVYSSTTTSDVNDQFGHRVTMTSDQQKLIVSKLKHTVGVDQHGQISTLVETPNQTWIETSRAPVPSTAITYWGQGGCISHDGTTALVGGPTVQVLLRTGTTWTEQAILNVSGIIYNEAQAFWLSADGNIAAIGARNYTHSGKSYAGGVYIFTRSGSVWSQSAILTASDAAASDYFGTGVCMNPTGTVIVVGAPNADVTGTADAGAVYIFTNTGGTWTQSTKITAANKAANNRFGSSVGVSDDGTVIAVGASGKGGGYVYRNISSVWTQEKYVVGSSYYNTGYFTSISGNGNIVAFGGRYAYSNVNMYSYYNGATWSPDTNLPILGYSSELIKSIDMNYDGSLLAIAVPASKPTFGKIFLHSWNGAGWDKAGEIFETVPKEWSYGTSSAFGQFVSLTDTTVNGIFTGVYGVSWFFDPGARYYEKLGTGWVTSDVYTSTQANTNFGYDIELLPDDQTMFVISVSTPTTNYPTCQVVKLTRDTSAWIESETIDVLGFSSINNISCSTDGSRIAIGGHSTEEPYTRKHGKVVVLEKQGSVWVEIFKQHGPHEGALFGVGEFSVKLSPSGERLLVGSTGYEDSELFLDNNTGQLFIFWNVDDSNSVTKYLPSDSQFFYARFGTCVEFDLDRGDGCFLVSNAAHFSDLSQWSQDPDDIGGMVYAICSNQDV